MIKHRYKICEFVLEKFKSYIECMREGMN